MNWADFPTYAFLSIILWLIGSLLLFLRRNAKGKQVTGIGITGLGIAVLAGFVTLLWIKLERPPMRTLGETRLWYSLFLSLIGFLVYVRWRYLWFLFYSIMMATLFMIINLLHPETYEKTLMPALQSVWFVPHVIVYILAYAFLGVSSLVALYGLYKLRQNQTEGQWLFMADNVVYLGFAFLTLGLVFGAIWAKEAWGHYWTWDPKETWALLTWLVYMLYIHLRFHRPRKISMAMWILALSFVVLLICWFGINYLPSAQNSVHVYS
jgi:ABC-type transport system involved in cytochrome c biogenesis permease subunit